MGVLRQLVGSLSPLVRRSELSRLAGKTHGGKRDMYEALGYPRTLVFDDYWEEYQRGGISTPIVEAYPRATWTGGATIIDRTLAGGTVEEADTEETTPFEEEIALLFDRLDIWSHFLRADILAGIGRYSIIVIGAPGDLESPLLTLPNGADDIMYLSAYAEDRADIKGVVESTSDPRFGLPEFYDVKISTSLTKLTHHTRVLPFADGLLDDDIYGQPRLKNVWNYLMDLFKIHGGGSEAAWKRMDPGLHIDVDPTIELDEAGEEFLEAEVDEYINDLRRTIRTRGTKVTPLFANVAAFSTNVDSIIQLISAAKSIPHRILTGSERGQLASTQDRNNWNDRVKARRRGFANPILSKFINMMIDLEAVPAPVNSFQARWPDVESMDEAQKARAISALAAANQAQFLAERKVVITANEMRDGFLQLGPLPDPVLPPPLEDTPGIDKRFIDDPTGDADA